jgi:hypothetical protein
MAFASASWQLLPVAFVLMPGAWLPAFIDVPHQHALQLLLSATKFLGHWREVPRFDYALPTLTF